MIAVLIGALGLIIGSFLNVVILRDSSTSFDKAQDKQLTASTGRSVFKGRSRCFACGHVLEWHELIPLISFFIQRGRCRACDAHISWQYPIVEFLTSIIFISVISMFYVIPAEPASPAGWAGIQFIHAGSQINPVESLRELYGVKFGMTLLSLLFFSLLLVISVYDFRTKIIPDRFVYPLIGLGAGYALLFMIDAPGASIWLDAIAAISAAAFFALLWLASRGRWIGFGDAKLTLGIGFFLGWPLIVVALLFAFWSAALAGLGLILFKGYTRKSEIPFGPFLALGAFAAFLIGEKILLWYGGII